MWSIDHFVTTFDHFSQCGQLTAVHAGATLYNMDVVNWPLLTTLVKVVDWPLMTTYDHFGQSGQLTTSDHFSQCGQLTTMSMHAGATLYMG